MPVFFSVKITDPTMTAKVIVCFICFCMVSSAVYILNDYTDIDEDKKHPQKKHRPLASGKVSKGHAGLLFITLLGIGFFAAAVISVTAAAILGCYLILNIAYSLRCKHIAIIDVVMIAMGFVLRLWAGALTAGLPLSYWIVIMTFLLALFLALAKRRDDVLIFNTTGKRMRKAVDGYNLQFVDAAMTLMSGIVIVSYIMYCTSEDVIRRVGNDKVYLTALFVIIGVLRYMQLSFVEKNSASPTRVLLGDRILQITVLLWFFVFLILLYI